MDAAHFTPTLQKASIMAAVTWQTQCCQRLENGMQAEDKDEQDASRNHTTACSTVASHPVTQSKQITISNNNNDDLRNGPLSSTTRVS